MVRSGIKNRETSVVGWILRGAIREDDGGTLLGTYKREPGDDPYGNINRFCNHFLDPINVRGTTGRGFSGYCLGESPIYDAAQWAIGDQSAFDPLPVEKIDRRNHFSVRDAREAMWRALTLTAKDGSVPPQFGYTLEEVRKVYWASTFRALGDVVHLLQDQAQPQHTRNEGHGSSNTGYEEYINARATRATQFVIDWRTVTQKAGQLPDLIYENGYPTPRFNRYSDYWSTRANSAKVLGIADYSNRGFFTFENNFGKSVYAEPSSNPVDYTSFPADSNYAGYYNHLVGTVKDDVTGASDTVTMTTEGVFKGMGGVSLPNTYTLQQKNFDDRAALLIPRAVAYSAGLIDYFFRGQLEIHLPNEGVYAILDHSLATDNCKDDCGFKKIKLKLGNSTPDITVSGGAPGTPAVPQAMAGGTLVAIAKYHRNKCYTTDLDGEFDSSTGELKLDYLNRCRDTSEEITVSQPLASQNVTACDATITAGDTACADKFTNASNPEFITDLTFTFAKAIPINATDLYLQVVYRGPLGSEQDAVVVGTRDIAEPTYFSIVNTLDYRVCYNRAWYYKDENGNLPADIPAMVDGKTREEFYSATNFSFWRVAFQPNESFSKPPIAKVDNIAPKEFARIAVLIEVGRTYNDDIPPYRDPVPPPYTLSVASILQIDYTADGTPHSTIFDYKPATVRKVKANVPLSGYKYNLVGSGGDCTGVPTPPEPGFPPHTKPTVMKPVTITLEP